MANEVTLGLDTSAAEAKVQRLREAIKAAKAEAADIGGGTGAPAGVQTTASTSATGMLHGSAQSGGGAGPSPAAALADVAVSKTQMGQWKSTMARYPGLSVGAQQLIAAEMGLPGIPTSIAATATQPVAQTVHGARTAGLVADPNATGVFTPGQLLGDRTIAMTAAQYPSAYAGGMSFGPWSTYAGGPTWRSMGAGVGVPAYAALNLSTQETVSGRPDLMGRAALPGQIVGGALGALTGSPAIAAGAALLGGQVSQWLMAPAIREQQVKEGFYPIAGLFGLGQDTLGQYAGWARGLSNSITHTLSYGSFDLPGKLVANTFSPQAIAAMGSTAALGIWMGGGNPFAVGGGFSGFPGTPAPVPPDPYRPTGRLLTDLPGVAGYGIRSRQYDRQLRDWRASGGEGVPAGTEEAWQRVVHNIAVRYPNEAVAQSVINRIAPIYGSRPETGDNPADILLRFGPQAAAEYYQSQAPLLRSVRWAGGGGGFDPSRGGYWQMVDTAGEPAISADTLRNASVSIRSIGRRSVFAGTLARGGPRAQQLLAEEEMGVLAGLPGGTSSLAYAEAGVRRRDAVRGAFAEYAGAAFELPLMQAEGALQRATMMPFAPGYSYGMALGTAGMRSAYLGAIRSYRSQRRRAGELSVEEELSLEGRAQALLTANQATLAMLSEGGPNLMASLSTGGPAGFGRFDAMQMAAVRLRGTPIRRFGAMGGAQARQQEAFLGSFGFGSLAPVSPTGALSPELGQVVSVLREILGELRRGGGSFPVRGRGPADLAPSGGYVQTGANAPFN